MDLRNCDNMKLMAEYPDKYFDLAIVDPPYGIDATKLKIRANKKDKHWDSEIPDAQYFKELFRVSKNQIIWGMNFLNDHLGRCEKTLIWDKQNDGTFGSDYELAWTSFEGSKQEIFRLMWYGYFYPKDELPLIHPTQKPIRLYRWMLDKFAKPNDKILDTHLGSGNIAIACHYLNFDLTACEIDTDYFNKALERIKQKTAQQQISFNH